MSTIRYASNANNYFMIFSCLFLQKYIFLWWIKLIFYVGQRSFKTRTYPKWYTYKANNFSFFGKWSKRILLSIITLSLKTAICYHIIILCNFFQKNLLFMECSLVVANPTMFYFFVAINFYTVDVKLKQNDCVIWYSI